MRRALTGDKGPFIPPYHLYFRRQDRVFATIKGRKYRVRVLDRSLVDDNGNFMFEVVAGKLKGTQLHIRHEDIGWDSRSYGRVSGM